MLQLYEKHCMCIHLICPQITQIYFNFDKMLHFYEITFCDTDTRSIVIPHLGSDIPSQQQQQQHMPVIIHSRRRVSLHRLNCINAIEERKVLRCIRLPDRTRRNNNLTQIQHLLISVRLMFVITISIRISRSQYNTFTLRLSIQKYFCFVIMLMLTVKSIFPVSLASQNYVCILRVTFSFTHALL